MNEQLIEKLESEISYAKEEYDSIGDWINELENKLDLLKDKENSNDNNPKT